MTPRLPYVSEASIALGLYSLNGAGTPPVAFDATKLMNTFRVPIEVSELTFMTLETGSVADILPLMQVSIKLGRQSITDDFVPLFTIAPYKVTYGDSYVSSAAGHTTASIRRLMFPKPIVLAPGQGFGIQARIPAVTDLAASALTSNATVKVGMIGRLLTETDRLPSVNLLPIISAVELSQSHRRSLEMELRNPLTKAIDVRRLVYGPWDYSVDAVFAHFSSLENTAATITLRYPNGDLLTPDADLLPRREMFSPVQVCPIRFKLEGGARLDASVSAATEAGTKSHFQIALFGTREEAL